MKRIFLIIWWIIGLLLFCAACTQLPKLALKQPEVSPIEDLMREHGVLHRLLLVYEAIANRLEEKKSLLAQEVVALNHAVEMIGTFIENYHEKLEEDHIFPRFVQAGMFNDLVVVLQEQHNVGRKATAAIKEILLAGELDDVAQQEKLILLLRGFITMYRVHDAREDTVLFPAFHAIVSPQEFYQLGELFEQKEAKLLGKKGFETIVERIANTERMLQIHDLASFTLAG